MNAPARPVVRDTADIQLNFSTLEGRIQYLKMSKEDLHVIWSVITAIGHAIDARDVNYSPIIAEGVVLTTQPENTQLLPLILISDFDRIFYDPTLFKELCQTFPTLLDDQTKVVCKRFLDLMMDRV